MLLYPCDNSKRIFHATPFASLYCREYNVLPYYCHIHDAAAVLFFGSSGRIRETFDLVMYATAATKQSSTDFSLSLKLLSCETYGSVFHEQTGKILQL